MNRNVITVLALLGGLALLVILSRGCSNSLNQTGSVVIHDNQEYSNASVEAQKLCGDILKKLDTMQTAESSDVVNLNKALHIYQAMLVYNPVNPTPEFAMGQVYEALGEHEKAIQVFDQYLAATIHGSTPEAQVTRADAHYLMAEAYVMTHEYQKAVDQATEAIKAFPAANYLVARASAYTQLGKKKEALDDLSEALSKDPDNNRARGLYKLLSK